jgi:hypothetical protein
MVRLGYWWWNVLNALSCSFLFSIFHFHFPFPFSIIFFLLIFYFLFLPWFISIAGKPSPYLFHTRRQLWEKKARPTPQIRSRRHDLLPVSAPIVLAGRPPPRPAPTADLTTHARHLLPSSSSARCSPAGHGGGPGGAPPRRHPCSHAGVEVASISHAAPRRSPPSRRPPPALCRAFIHDLVCTVEPENRAPPPRWPPSCLRHGLCLPVWTIKGRVG